MPWNPLTCYFNPHKAESRLHELESAQHTMSVQAQHVEDHLQKEAVKLIFNLF